MTMTDHKYSINELAGIDFKKAAGTLEMPQLSIMGIESTKLLGVSAILEVPYVNLER